MDLKKISVIAAIAVILQLIVSYPAMLLWNYCLVPAIPSVAEVSWIQMWGIQLLTGLVFKTSVSVK